MGKWQKKRYLLGNIALVVFLAFLVTLTWGATASAQQDLTLTVEAKAIVNNNQGLQLTFKISPVTPAEFQSALFTLKQGNTTIGQVYGRQISNPTYNAAYHVYSVVYTWTYSGGFSYNTQYTLSAIVYDGQSKSASITVEVPPPETPTGGGGGGGGAATTPTGPVTTTQEATTTPQGGVTAAGSLTGAVSTSGQATATLTVDTAKTLAALDKPEVKQLVLEIPKEVKTEKGTLAVEQATIKVAAEVVGKALDAGKQAVINVGELQVVIPPQALDLSAVAAQGATLSISVTRSTAASVQTQDSAMKVAGDVYTIEIRVESKGEDKGGISSFSNPVILSLTYDPTKLAAGEEQYLGAYRQEAGGWKYVGGKINRDARQVTVMRRSLSTYAVMAYIKTFADMAGHWADQAVKLMASRHVVVGMTAVNFVPENNVTRAEFAAMLLRALLIEPSAAGKSFKDVDEGAWYAAVVKTAAAQGLVKGYDDGTFKPNQKITRQELAAMTSRALAMKGLAQVDQAEVESILKQFSDQGKVSKWARASMATAVKYGVVSGRSASTCAPKATATRAEAATMIKNMLAALGEV